MGQGPPAGQIESCEGSLRARLAACGSAGDRERRLAGRVTPSSTRRPWVTSKPRLPARAASGFRSRGPIAALRRQ